MAEQLAIEIVQCQKKDLELLREVGLVTFSAAFEAENTPEDYEAYVSQAFDRVTITKELDQPASAFFFAKTTEGDVVGYSKLNFPAAQQEHFGDDCLEIQRIYSLPAFYGLGIGKALMEHAFEIARQHGFSFVWLGVWEHNPRAIRFYEKHGFEVFGQHPFLFGSDLQTDLLMRKYL